MAGGRALTHAALEVRCALEASVAGALEGPDDVDTVAVGTQAITQGTLVDICGGSTWLLGAGCEQMASGDPSAIYVSLRQLDTRAHQRTHTHTNTPSQGTRFLDKHTPALKYTLTPLCPLTRLTNAPSVDTPRHTHPCARSRRLTRTPSHPLTCKQSSSVDTHTDIRSHYVFTRTHKHTSHPYLPWCQHTPRCTLTQTHTQTHPRSPSPANTLTQEQIHTHA